MTDPLKIIIPRKCRGRNLARMDVLEIAVDAEVCLQINLGSQDSLVTSTIKCPYISQGGYGCTVSKSSGVICRYALSYPRSNDQLVETVSLLNKGR